MNDNIQNKIDDRPLSRREARQARREVRRQYGSTMVGGAILIALGLIFLLQNFAGLELNNWWALFILIPAAGAFGNTIRAYQDAGGRLTVSARGSLIAGLVLVMVTAIFLFGLNWSLFGPAVLILAGVGILINAALPG